MKHCMHILLLPVLVACSADDVYSPNSQEGTSRSISFEAELKSDLETRGVVTTDDNLKVFAVSASITDKNGAYVYFSHENYQFSQKGDKLCKSMSGNTYYWLDSDYKYDFFAYSPSSDMFFAEGIIDKFDYIVNDDVAKQTDIVVCSALDAAYACSVPLSFTHPLSRISLSQGDIMAKGTIKSISFSGIIGKGNYDMRKNEWTTLQADTTTFTYNCDKISNPSSSITGSEYNFFFIPQTLGSKAVISVNFIDSVGEPHIYEKKLTGEWSQGDSYNYSLGISPSFTFNIDSSLADAYYSIVKIKVNTTDIPANQEWAINATSSDGADVSVQWQENVNSLALLGFWTDKYEVNGYATKSARGSSTTESVTGSANDYIYVFLPENVSETDREITISAICGDKVLDSTVITQKSPAWVGKIGWSQLDDDSFSDFGFSWDRSLAYVLPYSVSEYGLETDFSKRDAVSLISSMINLADASAFTEIHTYYTYNINNIGNIWHYYLYLDYSLCNMLSANSRNDGDGNTLALTAKAGTAVTKAFELMIERAAQNGSGKKTLFRLPSSVYVQEDVVPRPKGTDNLTLSALCKVLKRNRYNYSVTQVGSVVIEYPSLAISEPTWFLPAIQEFNNLPDTIVEPVIPGMCWSSTVVAGTTRAYLGNGANAERTHLAHVRCCHLKQ